jgi:hypothetical protein
MKVLAGGGSGGDLGHVHDSVLVAEIDLLQYLALDGFLLSHQGPDAVEPGDHADGEGRDQRPLHSLQADASKIEVLAGASAEPRASGLRSHLLLRRHDCILNRTGRSRSRSGSNSDRLARFRLYP